MRLALGMLAAVLALWVLASCAPFARVDRQGYEVGARGTWSNLKQAIQ